MSQNGLQGRHTGQPPVHRLITRNLDGQRLSYGTQHRAAEKAARPVSRAIVRPRDCRSDYAAHCGGLQPRALLQIDATDRPALKRAKLRLAVTAGLFGCLMLSIAVKAVHVTFGALPSSVDHTAQASTDIHRADITDRNGVTLATEVATFSLYAEPHRIVDAGEAAAAIHAVLPDLSPERLLSRLTSGSRFTWLQRHVTPGQRQRLHDLGLPGIGFRADTRRFYPQGNQTAHLVGYTDIDNRGLAGVEHAMDEHLRTSGQPLTLSIDMRIQDLLHRELSAAMSEFGAIGAAGIIMDARTGEIAAMASLPDFDPMQASRASADQRFNRNTTGVYELGSTFKIFTTAMALEKGGMALHEGFDTARPIRSGGFTIRDFHPQARFMTVPEIFMYSSNIGTAHMAMASGRQVQRAFLDDLGLTSPVAVELPDRARPLVPDTWRDIHTMTISYGHGIAVTPLHLASATAAIVNGGVLHQPTLLRRDRDADSAGKRVISQKTSEKMRQLLRLAVEHGTGGKADVPGFYVGGKTGTAEKPTGGGYSERALISSFVAAFPIHDPQYVVSVMLDEPQGNEATFGYATAGWVAAPVVSRLVSGMAAIVGMQPYAPDDPMIRRSLEIRFDAPPRRHTPDQAPQDAPLEEGITRLASY